MLRYDNLGLQDVCGDLIGTRDAPRVFAPAFLLVVTEERTHIFVTVPSLGIVFAAMIGLEYISFLCHNLGVNHRKKDAIVKQ